MMCKGELAKDVINHVVDIDGRITIVKNVPADVCKQCGESYIDHDTAIKLEQIVEQAQQSGAEVTIINYYDKVA